MAPLTIFNRSFVGSFINVGCVIENSFCLRHTALSIDAGDAVQLLPGALPGLYSLRRYIY